MSTPTINSQRLTLLPTPFDAKRCNYYVDGSNIVIETIPQYLARVTSSIRDTELVSILSPKEGYISLGTYPIANFSTILANFNNPFYAFVGGLADMNFIKVIPLNSYAEMYEYENTNLTSIGTTLVYHAVNHFVTGLVSGFTFVNGIEGSGNITDYGGTVPGAVLLTDTAHGLTTGDIVTIHSSTSYNGTKTITKVTNDTFYFIATYISDQSADWAMGSYLRCSTGSDGIYFISFSLTSFAAVANKVFKFELNKNTTKLDNTAVSRSYSSTDYGSTAGGGLVSLVEGDRVWLSVLNNTDATDITIRHANVRITKA